MYAFRGLDEVVNLGKYKFLRTLWLNGNRVSICSDLSLIVTCNWPFKVFSCNAPS